MTAETRVGQDYERWLNGRSLSGKLYSMLATVPGSILVNTPAFRLDQELQLTPENRLLDIGCGRGSLLQLLGSKVRFDTPPTGVDISRTMLDHAATAAQGSSRPFRVAQASASSLPFADESFDVGICAYVVKHLDDTALVAFFGELKRVLSFGGVALVWEFGPTRSAKLNRWHRHLLTQGVSECNLRSYTDLSALALAAGFEWVGHANLRPFVFPPIPRTCILVGKAPVGWTGQPA